MRIKERLEKALRENKPMKQGNIIVQHDGKSLNVYLYSTCIARITENSIILCSGGYDTRTTSKYMSIVCRFYGIGCTNVRNWQLMLNNTLPIPAKEGIAINRMS